MSESKKGKKPWLGKHHTEESKRKQSEARKIYWVKRKASKELPANPLF